MRLLKCLARSLARNAARALANLVPLGEVLYEVVHGAWEDYHGSPAQQPAPPQGPALVAEVRELIAAPPAEVQRQAAAVVREEAAGLPPQIQERIRDYLGQVPGAMRQSLRRPADPTGATVPPSLALRRPEDLLPLLPQKLPRFKPGDRPLPGVDWQLTELLGAGGFGEVWKATNPHMPSADPVALKFCLDPQAAQTLRHEAAVLDRVMRQGRHPGIVQLLRTYLSADPPCLEYEFIGGGDLAGLVRELHQHGPAPADVATRWLLQVTSQVSFAHRLQPALVHRDLKPANVLVQRAVDNAVSLRIADFGISGLAAGQAISAATRGVSARGAYLATVARGAYTPLYASPQQMRGEDPDPRDDVFALGIIWYQMLTGDLGAGRPGGRSWRRQLAERGAAAELLDLLEGCVDDNPTERPADAGELVRQLEALLQRRPAPQSEPNAQSPAAARPSAPGSLVIGCPNCSTRMQVPADATGKQFRCPFCKRAFTVGPVLSVSATEINLGRLQVGESRSAELRLKNNGPGQLSGTAFTDCPWLSLGGTTPATPHWFQFPDATTIPVRVVGDTLRAGNKPLEAKVVIESNGGNATVTVRAEVPVRPFAEGVLTGATPPRQLAEKAKQSPRDAAPLFEKGAVAAWYKANGWAYPIQVPPAEGLAAIQQFFEALGLTPAPRVRISDRAVTLQGSVGDKNLRHVLEIKTDEKKPAYAHGTGNVSWLEVSRPRHNGRIASITLTVPTVPNKPGETLTGKVIVQANGNQRFVVPVTLQVAGPFNFTAAPVPNVVPVPVVEASPLPPITPTHCPACNSALLPGAIACMDCGFLLQGETSDLEGPPNLCHNPACGVANPPGERNCQRCGTPLPLPHGTLLHDRYRLERLLATGGFGAVYLASDTRNNNRPVVLKDMLCVDPQEFAIRLNFFRREAETLRLLQHVPIVPRLHDLIEQGQSAHLVMEFIKGQDLLKRMEANGNRPFPLDKVIEWGKGLCDLLTAMHELSPPWIRRDMKPDDVILLEDLRSIRVVDFGSSRPWDRSKKMTRVYTEGYAPPEQIVGRPEPRSDLFSLAATLYHLATGKAPEGYLTGREIESRLAVAGYPAEQRWFFELLKINLAEDVNERSASARQIKTDLEKHRVTRLSSGH